MAAESLQKAGDSLNIPIKVETNGSPWIAIQPKADVGLAALRKDWIKIEKAAGLNCAIFFDSTSFYIKEKLLEEGIPFVLKDKQVYLPFIGYLLSNENERKISPVHLISFLTQKVILVAIYEKWENVTASKAAIRLGVTKMSANRCFDEIEYLNVDILGMKGKSRVITVPADIQKLWNDVRVILRNPVIARYELKEDIQLEKKAGITALCEYSLLSDNEYPTYAITKKEITESGIRKMKQVHSGEEIGCVVLELGYFINFKNKKLNITSHIPINPICVIISLLIIPSSRLLGASFIYFESAGSFPSIIAPSPSITRFTNNKCVTFNGSSIPKNGATALTTTAVTLITNWNLQNFKIL